MPRKTEENSNRTTSLVTLIVGFVGATIAIVVSNLTLTNKAIGALALAFAGYAVYNELDKHFAKITPRARKNSEAKENSYLQLLRINNMSVLFTVSLVVGLNFSPTTTTNDACMNLRKTGWLRCIQDSEHIQ